MGNALTPGRHRAGRWRSLVAVAAASSVALVCSGSPPEGGRQSLYGQHVVAHFPRRAVEQAHIAVGEADELASQLMGDLGVRLDDRAEIIICLNHADFERAAGKRVPVWVLGLARPGDNQVLLKELPPLSFRKLVRHEVVHLFVGRALGSYAERAPRWLHEGTAKYYAGDWSGREIGLLADAARTGRLHSIAELATFPTDPQQSSIAYAESYVLIEHLISLDPKHELSGFITNLKETEDVGRAFRRAYGLSTPEVEAGWRELIARRSRRVPLPWAVEAAIFFAMVLIFGVAYLRVRRRSREIRERMEEEELLERLFDGMQHRPGASGPHTGD